MSGRRRSKCTIGDIIAGIVRKNSLQAVSKGRSISERLPHANDQFFEAVHARTAVGRAESQRELVGSGAFEPDLKNWLAFTPQSRSRLLQVSPLDRPHLVFRKYTSSRQAPSENPESFSRKWEAYGPRRRQASKLEPFPQASDPKLPAQLIDNFREFKMQAKLPARTASSFYFSPSSNKKSVTLKVNNNYVTLSTASRPLWQRRQSPFLTFYK